MTAIFLTLMAYMVMGDAAMKRPSRKPTKAGWMRGLLLAAILFSGVFLAIRNFSGSNLFSALIILLDLGRPGSVMAFLLLSTCCPIFRKKWTTVI